ncbi:MAG: hypothetical protein PHG89_00510 [Gallionella sp.]|nr:hypothetical protein [Gallionella sp.]
MHTRQFASPSILLIAALALVGCDRITGAGQQKTLDAEAIGYACRISLKTPEDCMKENEVQSPTSVLFGWKEADKDIKEKAIDPSMGKTASQTPQSAPAAAETEGKTAPSKAVENAAATGKPDKGAAEQKTNH